MFQVRKTIRFHHCDPAGIVFFPNYLVLCNEVIEDWFDASTGLGIGYQYMLNELKFGMPAVKVTTEYLLPSSYGDELTFELSVKKLGNSSMTLLIRAQVAEQERMRTELTMVLAQLQPFKSVRIPDEFRIKMQPFMSHA